MVLDPSHAALPLLLPMPSSRKDSLEQCFYDGATRRSSSKKLDHFFDDMITLRKR